MTILSSYTEFDVTTPLYGEGSPTITELATPGSSWRVPDALIDRYLELAPKLSDRRAWRQAESTARDATSMLSRRDIARSIAGLPRMTGEPMPTGKLMPLGAASSDRTSAARATTDVEAGWPSDVPRDRREAYVLHLTITERAASQQQAARMHTAITAQLGSPCPVCGAEQTLGHGVCAPCERVIAQLELEQLGAEKVDRRTRRQLAQAYLERGGQR